MRNLTTLALAAAAILLTNQQVAQAVVLASDDFDTTGVDSGVGWAPGSDWAGGGTISGGVLDFGDIGRHFATPIDPFALGKVYISVDYTQTSVADGNDGPRPLGSFWGGVTIYEPDNAEAIFIGNPWGGGPDGLVDYGVATAAGNVPDNILHSGVAFDDQLHTLVVEVDTTVPDTIGYRFWFDGDTNLDAPTDALSVPAADSPIDTTWGFLYFRADTGATTNQGDNLIIATAPEDVGLSAVPEPTTAALFALSIAMAAAGRKRRTNV